jgi:hypothetical protein
MEPDPQTGEDATEREPADERAPSHARSNGREDDSPAERYRDSPGMGVIDPSNGVPEPNEPG